MLALPITKGSIVQTSWQLPRKLTSAPGDATTAGPNMSGSPYSIEKGHLMQPSQLTMNICKHQIVYEANPVTQAQDCTNWSTQHACLQT